MSQEQIGAHMERRITSQYWRNEVDEWMGATESFLKVKRRRDLNDKVSYRQILLAPGLLESRRAFYSKIADTDVR